MTDFKRHMRNVMRQDQVDALYRDWLNQMSSTRMIQLAAAATHWLEANNPEEKRHGTLPVPADVAHEAVACLVLRLSAELTNRLHIADGSVE